MDLRLAASGKVGDLVIVVRHGLAATRATGLAERVGELEAVRAAWRGLTQDAADGTAKSSSRTEAGRWSACRGASAPSGTSLPYPLTDCPLS